MPYHALVTGLKSLYILSVISRAFQLACFTYYVLYYLLLLVVCVPYYYYTLYFLSIVILLVTNLAGSISISTQ